MEHLPVAKRKILNDPIYGFISIPYEIVFDLVEHPYFQRLRRISQVGLTYVVYSGAHHTRFQHALGAMHLMGEAIKVIRSKGIEITEEEAVGVTIAILLHDIGHGPYSHTLEHSLVDGVSHEDLSLILMDRLNQEFDGQLELAISIFKNQYHKRFLHQLVSSQLDMDRLDYLKRDSFFSGVSEGVVSSDRIIKMLQVVDDELVVEAKAIYSIEKFLVARRLMYWQVYLHKTVLGAEYMLMKILQRAKELAGESDLFGTPSLKLFLENRWNRKDFEERPEVLHAFTRLDDYDILSAVKVWQDHSDTVLSTLCKGLINRNLFRVQLQNEAFDSELIAEKRKQVQEKLQIPLELTNYFVFDEVISNSAYQTTQDRIKVLYKDGTVLDVSEASDMSNISTLSAVVRKHFLCSPKFL